MRNKKLLAAALLALGAGAAQAQVYGQVGGGYAHAGMSCPGQERCDGSGYAMRGLVGYRFASGWALEGGLLQLGGFSHSHAPISYDMEARAWMLGAAHHAQLGQKGSLVWRAGLASVHSSTDNLLFAPGSNKQTEVQPYVGVDLGYRLNKLISLRAGLDFSAARVLYRSGESESVRLQALTLGVGFNF